MRVIDAGGGKFRYEVSMAWLGAVGVEEGVVDCCGGATFVFSLVDENENR